MNQNERPRPDHPSPPPDESAGNAGGANLNAIRQTAGNMLTAADDAITRVLSGDSQAFNTAVRQGGGQ